MSKLLTTEQYITDCIAKHGERYDYSKVDYKGKEKNIIIGCKKHGWFSQQAANHKKGHGCYDCSVIERAEKRKINEKEFFHKCNKKHDFFYDYSQSIYTKAKDKIIIICPDHGPFKQVAYNHSIGMGCQSCANKVLSEKAIKSKEEVIYEIKNIFGDLFLFDLFEYKGRNFKSLFICKNHGIFEQTVGNMLKGHNGCKKCNSKGVSKKELEILSFVNSIKNTFSNSDKTVLINREIDILSKTYNLGIEFNGLYWHSDTYKKPNDHLNKTNDCNDNGIELIHIFEDEWDQKNKIVKSFLKHKIIENNNNYENANFITINNDVCYNFVSDNSLFRFEKNGQHIGLINNDSIIAVCTLQLDKNILNIKNLCSSIFEGNKPIIMLINYVISNFKYDSIIIEFNKRFGSYSFFTDIGFKNIKEIQPKCFYLKNNSLQRFYFLKNYARKIYDCGYVILQYKN